MELSIHSEEGVAVWGDGMGGWKLEEGSPIFPGQAPSICGKRESTRTLQSMPLPLAKSVSIPCFLKQANKQSKRITGLFCHFLALRWCYACYLCLVSLSADLGKSYLLPSKVFMRMEGRNLCKAPSTLPGPEEW